MIAYLDTNVVLRLQAGLVNKISDEAERVIERSNCLISPMVQFELELLYEIGRIKYGAAQVLADLSRRIGLQVCQLSMAEIVLSSFSIKWTREPGDRIIVANALANGNALLVTSDSKIRSNYANSIW